MLTIHGVKTDKIGRLIRTRAINELDRLSFTVTEEHLDLVDNERKVIHQGHSYLIKEIDNLQIRCVYDVNELREHYIENMVLTARTIEDNLNTLLDGTGWTAEGVNSTDRRAFTFNFTNVYDALLEFMQRYAFEIRFDNQAKKITYAPTIGEDRGVYFAEGLNINSLNKSSQTYEFATRIEARGADGLTFAPINGGKTYLEDHSLSDAVIVYYWEDSRYHDQVELKRVAQEKLDKLAKRNESYEVRVKDLAALSDKYEILDYQYGDFAKIIKPHYTEKHRILKTEEHLYDPTKNTCVLSNKPITLTDSTGNLREIITENYQRTEAHLWVLDDKIRSRVTKEEVLTDPDIRDALKGDPGEPGQDATKSWTHVKFARDGVGTDMSDLPEDRTYIGIGMEKPYPTPSTDHLEYYWGTFRGTSYGVPLRDGKFAWVKFADTNKGIGMSNDPEGKRYVGVAIKTIRYEGTTPSEYDWRPIYEREIIVQPTEPTEVYPTGQIWLDTSMVPSQIKRWTGSEWEVVNDTSQLENILSGKLGEQDVQDLIEAIAGTMISTSETEISQTTDAITQRVTQTIAALDEYGRHLTALEEKQEMVWRLTADGIEFGQTDNPIRTIQKPDRYAFIDQAGNEVAYFSNWELFVTSLSIPMDGNIKHGPLMWTFRSNGNYDLIRVGE